MMLTLQDIPLFEGIVQDLFPSEKDSNITTDPALEAALKNTLAENNLQVGLFLMYFWYESAFIFVRSVGFCIVSLLLLFVVVVFNQFV